MDSQAGEVRWGILGPGEIARRFASQLDASERGRLVAVASRDAARAEAFAGKFGAERAHGSYAELLADPDVDAVYISTVHTAHAQYAVQAADAGKDVLCEKPAGVNLPEVMAIVEAARRNGVALLEAYMYRFHPQTVRLLELVAQNAIGRVQHIEAQFSFAARNPLGRLFDPALAGGGILDVGGYPVSAALAVAAAAGDHGEPVIVSSEGTVGGTGVDEWATATLRFPGGVTAQVSCGIRLAGENRLMIVGSAGVLTVASPWVLAPDQPGSIRIQRVGEDERVEEIPAAAPYAREADALASAVDGQVKEFTWNDSLAVARALEAWRSGVGVQYPFEAETADIPTVSRRPLVRRAEAMRYGRIPGVDKDISRLVMGCDNQRTLAHASVVFDDFVERGGTAFDTAHQYGGGLMERLLGQWMRNRGNRDEVFVIGKGAHTPECDPEHLTSQLLESLERLQTDSVDLYLMHRDNLDIPVSEFVDVLDEHYRAGRVKAFGGSNWTIARFNEANEYAAANGKQGFSALSNHFGLARAYDVPWAGCEHATDPESKAWLRETKVPLFPWSSQARGFFARADPADTSDPQLVRCYYAPDNFERLRRARELASQLGVEPTAIALAYVISQEFPTFALFGPRTLTETRTSMDAVAVELTPEQVRWLDLEDEG